MATQFKPAQTEWSDKPAVQKGDYGEGLVKGFFEGKGYIIYAPITMRAHPVDMLAYKNDKVRFALEVKTKTMCKKFPETGIDYQQYERYMQFAEENNLPVLVVFVDEERREIYGNYLHELDKAIHYKGMDYPKTVRVAGGTNTVRYFPECHMRHLRALTELEVRTLKSFSTKRYTEDDWFEQSFSFGQTYSRY